MKKPTLLKQLLDYWPLVVAAVSAIGTAAVLLYQVNGLVETEKHRGEWLERIEDEVQNIRVDCAKLGSHR